MRILFLCSANSCRSQMAEGWTRQIHGNRIEAFSAGLESRGLDPRAVRVMKEEGVDISGQVSKRLEDLEDTTFDVVVTVCGRADEHCPTFRGKTRVVHVDFDDPPALARSARTEDEALTPYRRVGEEIRVFVEGLPESLDRADRRGGEDS